MAILQEMAAVAAECVKKPGKSSVWSERLGKYICSDDPMFQQAVAEQRSKIGGHPTINPTFKLVFLTAAGGTLLFVTICIVATVAAGKSAPPALERLITGLIDLAKIGFGAVVGLLGGPVLTGKKGDPKSPGQ